MSALPSATARVDRRASVAPWLGVLLMLMLTLNTLGGWVRLSGSGIAIPQWPLIHGSFLPPTTHAGWVMVRADWEHHQADLRYKVSRGELNPGNLGREPSDDGDFQRMFFTEYGHRLLAALSAVVLAGVLTVIFRDAYLRRRIGGPMAACAGLVVAQAVLGGLLVDQGTNTHFLFLHQGNSSLILGCILWSLLRLLDDARPQGTTAEVAAPRSLRRLLGVAAIATWIQLVLGALVAGSKFNAPASGFGAWLQPLLWQGDRSWASNLLDNAALLQGLHRIGAWFLVSMMLLCYWRASRHDIGDRLRLALQVSATFIAIQVILGISSLLVAGTGVGNALPLAHQLMGMCVFCSVVLCWYDARHELARRGSMAAPAQPSPRDSLAGLVGGDRA